MFNWHNDVALGLLQCVESTFIHQEVTYLSKCVAVHSPTLEGCLVFAL